MAWEPAGPRDGSIKASSPWGRVSGEGLQGRKALADINNVPALFCSTIVVQRTLLVFRTNKVTNCKLGGAHPLTLSGGPEAQQGRGARE